ncbi:peptidoglycan DD-metalloendopeptidase family protein [Alkaliphilus sp. MSJ-5]|uniref:Peptidoglycan DD-metalloendopeptidase family protein n=1 Tax=Alkaliphilus flagellatus TaxID=2841507 RepID=A0ABS6FY66_9FIRM|nr:M23 family metallopeptidase [Alkaliphilus flagellatus]MBU5674999.1 peptidoglycan DD-metalloendopeptidase family protein [Alkaliphilus flagellatus]
MKKKHGLALVILFSMTTTSLFSFANNATQYKNQLKQNESKQKNITTELKKTVKKEGEVVTKIQSLEEEINKSESEIESLYGKISTTEGEINKTVNKLTSAEEKIDDKQDVMGSRLNVMYKNGTIGYAEVLLSSKSITELLTNLDMVKKIVNHDVELLKDMKEQRDIIEEQKISLENQKRQLVNLKSSVEQKKKTLVVSRGEQERLRADLAQDKVALEKMLDQTKKEADEITNKIRSLQSNGAYVGGQLQWPVPGYSTVSSPFGNRIHPVLKTKKFHSGIDIPAPSGRDVVAAGDGKVVSSGGLGSYGKAVIIDHGGGIMTLYAHNSKLLVQNGQTVTKGQKIALIGSTGLSTGPHLHFEVRKDGQYTNPIPYVRGK